MQNLVRDATRYGGDGWRAYDYIFQSQEVADPSRNWEEPDTSLVLGYMVRTATPGLAACVHYFDVDHTSQSYALAPFNTPVSVSAVSLRPHPPQVHSLFQNICISWNRGACAMPGTCRYRHVCASCPHPAGQGEKHMAKGCPLTSDDSLYKRPSKHPKGSPKQ